MNLKTGDKWNGWTIGKRLGVGSFGNVYEIYRNLDSFGTLALGSDGEEHAALKIISIPKDESEVEALRADGYNDESIKQYFKSDLADSLHEYQLASSLKGNSNIVDCDDVQYVRHENGFGWDLFIRMELLTSLKEDYANKDYSEDYAKRLAVDICKALVLCGKKNIIHRDIKPENIFISKMDQFKLGDFGVAKISERTVAGTITGTPDYMAPEVYYNQPYGGSSDIYSLGIVLYWILNDRKKPFQIEETPTKAMKSEAFNRRMQGEQIPPPAHGSNELQKIVLKACAFDLEKRYKSATEMLSDLQQIDRISSSKTVQQGFMALERKQWIEAKQIFQSVISTETENSEAYLGLFLVEHKYGSLKSYYHDLAGANVSAVATDVQLPEEKNRHIDAMVSEYAVPGYLEKDTIRMMYDFALTYKEETAPVQKYKKDILEQLSTEPLLIRALSCAKNTEKERLEAERSSLIHRLDQRIRTATEADAVAINTVLESYEAHAKDADKKVKELHAKAIEKKESELEPTVVEYNYHETPTVLQTKAVECGAASLAMILAYFGKNISLEQMQKDTHISDDVCNANKILKAAKYYHLECHGFEKSAPALKTADTPCVIHWNSNHFVVFEGIKKESAYINDPSCGHRVLPWREFEEGYSGIVLTFKTSDDFLSDETVNAKLQTLFDGKYRDWYIANHIGQNNGLGSSYHIRQIVPGGSTDAVLRTFYKKAFVHAENLKLVYKLNHAVIARIQDVVEDGDTIYVVQEYIQGTCLNSNKPYPVQNVLAWAKTLVDYLEYLQSFHPPYIHGDLKPNVLRLSASGINITGFSLFHPYGTYKSIRAGTKGYSAPECWDFGKKHAEPDIRSDIFSLGATMYTLLTGVPAFDTLSYSIRDINRELPEKLDRIILKCTEEDPNKRYQTCEELRRDLNKIQLDKQESKDNQIFDELESLLGGKYKILRILGGGGSSEVYLAVSKGTGKRCAVKRCLKRSIMTYQNLIAEASILKRLDHISVPHIYDVIDTADYCLVVTDYVEGTSLSRVVKESGAQSEENVIKWAKQLCDVLGYLHAQQPPIIYCVMKPENIMLQPNGDIMLFDFGEKVFRDNCKANPKVDRLVGYLAPEQIGGIGQTDTRTDIYNLGATIYHLVTGFSPKPSLPPYHGMVPIRKINPKLSIALEKTILKCTQAKPADRYQSVDELRQALEHIERKAEKNDNRSDEIKQKPRNRKPFVALIFILLAAISLFIGKNKQSNDSAYESVVDKTIDDSLESENAVSENDLSEKNGNAIVVDFEPVTFQFTDSLVSRKGLSINSDSDIRVYYSYSKKNGYEIDGYGVPYLEALPDDSGNSGYTVTIANIEIIQQNDKATLDILLTCENVDTRDIACSWDIYAMQDDNGLSSELQPYEIELPQSMSISVHKSYTLCSDSPVEFCFVDTQTGLGFIAEFPVDHISEMDMQRHSEDENSLSYRVMKDNEVISSLLKSGKYDSASRSSVEAIQFLNSTDSIPDDALDYSCNGDGSVMTWIDGNTIYIAGDGMVIAPEDSSYLFSDCASLKQIDLQYLDTSNVADMSFMFFGCNSLEELNLESFDTSYVTSMDSMFLFCRSLKNVDLSSFDTHNVVTMSGMFWHCESLETIDICNFDTSSVKNFSGMFFGCYSLVSVDISNFILCEHGDLTYLFGECNSLCDIGLVDLNFCFDMKVTGMLFGCNSLVGVDYSSLNQDDITAQPDW